MINAFIRSISLICILLIRVKTSEVQCQLPKNNSYNQSQCLKNSTKLVIKGNKTENPLIFNLTDNFKSIDFYGLNCKQITILCTSCQIRFKKSVTIKTNLTIKPNNNSIKNFKLNLSFQEIININQNLIIQGNRNLTDLFEVNISGKVIVEKNIIIDDKTYWNISNNIDSRINLNNVQMNAKNTIQFRAKSKVLILKSSISVHRYFCKTLDFQLTNIIKNFRKNKNVCLNQFQKQQILFIVISLDLIELNNNDLSSFMQVKSGFTLLLSFKDIKINFVKIVSTSAGCKNNWGTGAGIFLQFKDKDKDQYCTSGAGSANYGSVGFVAKTLYKACRQNVESLMFIKHSFPYLNKFKGIAAGSGGYKQAYRPQMRKNRMFQKDYQQKSQNIETNKSEYIGGTGGGIIFIYSQDNLSMNGTLIQSSGGAALKNETKSAGAGGSIWITCNKLFFGKKTNQLNVTGGNSQNEEGAGSGGIIKMAYLKVEKQKQQRQSSVNPVISLKRGLYFSPNPSDSDIKGHGFFHASICSPGFQRVFMRCQQCESFTYNLLGDTMCRECPQSFFFTKKKFNQNYLVECFQNHNSNLIKTLDPLNLSWQGLVVYTVYLLVLAIILFIHSKFKAARTKTKIPECDINILLETIERKRLNKQIQGHQKLKKYQLFYHIHRISVYGYNTDESSWVLSANLPPDTKQYIIQQNYKQFAKEFNQIAKWTQSQVIISWVLMFIYPFYWLHLNWVSKCKYQKLCILLENKLQQLINLELCPDSKKFCLVLNCNRDHNICFLDLLYDNEINLKYINLTSPFMIYFSGIGTFLRPFCLSRIDIFLQALFYIVNSNSNSEEEQNCRKKLCSVLTCQKKKQQNCKQVLKFIKKLNRISCTLDLSAPVKNISKTLQSLLFFITNWNHQYFKHLNIRLDLLIIITKLDENNQMNSDIHILSQKKTNQYSNFAQKLKNNNPSIAKIQIALFVYNPQQEIKMNNKIQHQNKVKNFNFYEMSQSQLSDERSAPLLDQQSDNQENQLTVKSVFRLQTSISRILGRIRYYMFAHRSTSCLKFNIKICQIFVILLELTQTFVWSIKLQLPYFGANLLRGFLGIFWIYSDGYSLGRCYLILTALSFFNKIFTLPILRIYNQDYQKYLKNPPILCCYIISVILNGLMIIIGSYAIVFSRKIDFKNIENEDNYANNDWYK